MDGSWNRNSTTPMSVATRDPSNNQPTQTNLMQWRSAVRAASSNDAKTYNTGS